MGESGQNQPGNKIFMADRKEVAGVVYHEYRHMQRATSAIFAEWGRWLVASLMLVHGGALFGLFGFLGKFADKPESLAQYQWTVWWFVGGMVATFAAGFCAWLNWSMHSDNYDSFANMGMLWDPEVWCGPLKHDRGLWWTNWLAIIFGFISAFCIVGGAYSTLYGNWISKIGAVALA
ncbi:hypothetical protein SAMN05421890_4061 [Ensifer adhaerens]|nr:hypothetical protein SAMN05421890_4061 [Ensifer adhaerens]